MGNRAVICFDQYTDNSIGIYLHWNGGRDSVEGFLEAARRVMGSRLGDRAYAKARLVGVIHNFLDGNLSLGLGYCKDLDCDNWDNGVYIVDSATLEIIGREFAPVSESDYDNSTEIAALIMQKIDAGLELSH